MLVGDSLECRDPIEPEPLLKAGLIYSGDLALLCTLLPLLLP